MEARKHERKLVLYLSSGKVYNCVVTTCPCFYSHFAFLRNVFVTIVDFNNCYPLITLIFIIVC